MRFRWISTQTATAKTPPRDPGIAFRQPQIHVTASLFITRHRPTRFQRARHTTGPLRALRPRVSTAAPMNSADGTDFQNHSLPSDIGPHTSYSRIPHLLQHLAAPQTRTWGGRERARSDTMKSLENGDFQNSFPEL